MERIGHLMGKRILTAVIGVPVLLGLLYLGGLPWLLFIAALMAIAAFEMTRIARHMNLNVALWAVWLSDAVMLIAIYLNSSDYRTALGIAVGFACHHRAGRFYLSELSSGRNGDELFLP